MNGAAAFPYTETPSTPGVDDNSRLNKTSEGTLASKQLVGRSNRPRDAFRHKPPPPTIPNTPKRVTALPNFSGFARKVAQSSISTQSGLLTSDNEDSDMITISQGLQQYKIYAQAAGHSQRTINWITSSVRYFSEFLGEKQDVDQITANDLRRFIINWGQRPKFVNHPFKPPQNATVSPMTVQTYARGISAFFGHLAAEELIDSNPLGRVKIPKVPTKAIPTFTASEIERLLRCPNRNTPTGFRDYALILTFLDTETRLSELCNLKDKDVDLEAGYLKVMGKGGKERTIPIGTRVCRALLKYRLKYRPQPIGTEAFWLTAYGDQLQPHRVECRISRYGKQAGLERCYPHKLRHTGSVFYLRNGGDPFSLQKMLGHTSLQMTRHYCNLADTDVKQAHTKFGVGDRLKI